MWTQPIPKLVGLVVVSIAAQQVVRDPRESAGFGEGRIRPLVVVVVQ